MSVCGMKPVIEQRFELRDFNQAFDSFARGETFGKVVITGM